MRMDSQVHSLIDRVMIPLSATVPVETPIEDAIAQMHKTQDSCVLITQDQRPIGTFTDQDLVRSSALARTLLREPISTVMVPTKNTIFVDEIKDAFVVFQRMQQQNLYHLPVIDDTNNVIGTITQHSLKRAFHPIDMQPITQDRKILEDNSKANRQEVDIVGSNSEQCQIEQLKGEFIAMVSHELRTPLTSIHGGIKLLSQGIVPSESAQGQYLLQVAEENSERLVRLVSDILELERLESRKVFFQKQLINSQNLTGQISELTDALIKQKDIKLEIIDEGVQIVADSDRITQVLTHLLDNAIRFSTAGSTIRLKVELLTSYIDHDTSIDSSFDLDSSKHGEATVLFTICDQGIGISPEQHHKIFGRFVQGDRCYIPTNVQTDISKTSRSVRADSASVGGTGLGLSICQNIVEQHDGKIWVESQVGTGSCFHFTLPTRCEQQSEHYTAVGQTLTK